MRQESPVEIFISYSHKDKRFRAGLAKYLAPLEQAGKIAVWYDHDLMPGSEWNKEITKRLDSARIILLLLSEHFYDSDYCYNRELPHALKRHAQRTATVIPVILTPLVREDCPCLKLQALPDHYKPVSKWKKHSEAFQNIADGVARVIGAANEKVKSGEDWLVSLQRSLSQQYESTTINIGDIATTYSAVDKVLGRRMIIKAVRPSILNQEDKERIKQEIVRAAGLKHRSLIKTYGARFNEEPHYVVMEFINGTTLDRIIQRFGRQPLAQIRKVMQEIGEAVTYLHRKGIVHGNIRASNVMVDDERVAVLAPFKFLRSSYRPKTAETGEQYQIDERAYQSPEEYEGEKPEPTEKSDQYALGLLAYEMILGTMIPDQVKGMEEKICFIADPDPGQELRQVCPGLAGAVLRMLSADPDERYPTVHQAVAAITGYGTELVDEQELGKSYRRCVSTNPDFTEKFYYTLFEMCKPAEAIFKREKVSMSSQYVMLRHALDMLISYPSDAAFPRIVGRHQAIGIDKELYAQFGEALIMTLKECDKKWQPDLETAWRERISKALTYFMQMPSATPVA